MQPSPSLWLAVFNSRKDQLINLSDAFKPIINKQKELIGFQLHPCNQVISPEEFEPIKSLLARLAPEALDASLELLLTDQEYGNCGMFHKDYVYYEISDVEIVSCGIDRTQNAFSMEITLTLHCSIRENLPVFMYTADGIVQIEYLIGPGFEVIGQRIGFIIREEKD